MPDLYKLSQLFFIHLLFWSGIAKKTAQCLSKKFDKNGLLYWFIAFMLILICQRFWIHHYGESRQKCKCIHWSSHTGSKKLFFYLLIACSTASRALLEAVNEVYEPEWGGKELLTVNSQSVELLWNDFAHRLAEQVLIPLNTYQVCTISD